MEKIIDKERFARDLEIARDRSGMTQPQLAKKLKLTPNAIRKWEEADSFPRPNQWESIRQATGINPQDYVVYPEPHGQQRISAKNRSYASGGEMTVTNNTQRKEMSLDEQYLIKLLREKDTTKKYINEFIKKLLSLDE